MTVRLVLVGLFSAVAVGAGAAPVQAYSDVERFSALAGAGGGGGRQFTGSPVDGYGCNVCHRGGAEPKVEVRGLPEGYTPGKLYEVEVIWENPTVPHALQLEFVGRDGLQAGKLLLLDNQKVDAAARCNSAADKLPADYETMVGGRKVLGVQGCGASHMRFRFGPPDAPDVAFALSVVSSDKSGSADGDGVFNFRQVLRRAGEPAPSKGCSVRAPSAPAAHGTPGTHGGSLSALAGLLLLGFWFARRRAR